MYFSPNDVCCYSFTRNRLRCSSVALPQIILSLDMATMCVYTWITFLFHSLKLGLNAVPVFCDHDSPVYHMKTRSQWVTWCPQYTDGKSQCTAVYEIWLISHLSIKSASDFRCKLKLKQFEECFVYFI